MKSFHKALLGLAMLGAAATVQAQNEQFIPMNGYWVGPYAPGGSGIFGGFIDYVNMINAREGGVNGVSMPVARSKRYSGTRRQPWSATRATARTTYWNTASLMK